MTRKVSAKTATERFRRLLSHGFFAPELPPCFVSEDLARDRASIWKEVAQATNPTYDKFISQTSWFHFPRFNRNDRRYGVINPIAYLAISKVVADEFVKLRSDARRNSGMSASPLVFDWNGSRAILRPSIDLRDDFRVDLASRREEFVSADLRAFYHSIYTHSIPWAIRGKATAKADQHSNHFANLLDRLCRNAQDRQTIGLPVGPDTSRVIGEVVASGIDAALKAQISLTSKDASRYVDDYTISSGDGLSGQAIVAALRRAAADFELELNHDKTEIVSTSARLDVGWKQVALAHRPAGSSADYPDFQRFFYEVARLSRELPNTNIKKWALQNARSAFLGADRRTWRRLQSHLINAYRRNGTLVSLLVELFVARQQTKHDVDLEGIRDFLDHRIPALAQEDRTGELIWFLFLMITLEITIDARQFTPLFGLEEPMCALLLVAAHDRGLVSGRIDTATWNRSLDEKGLQGPMWLYAYEGVRQGIVPGASRSFIELHPYFLILLRKDVGFLSIDQGIEAIAGRIRRLRIDNIHRQQMRDDFADDFDVDLEFVEDDVDALDDLDDLDFDY